MGRETTLLLALLGLLAGVFFGVVSLKLFVPRPPVGAGPDVHGDVALAEAQDLVDPPELTPSTGSPELPPPAAIRPVDDPSSGRVSRFSADPPAVPGADPGADPERLAVAAEPVRDPFVSRASFETEPLTAAGSDAGLPEESPDAGPAVAALETPVATGPMTPPAALPPPAFAPPPAAVEPATSLPAPSATAYVARSGDSWWSIAEQAYGDGRLYRALFAWNRVADPRVSLSPGTRLEIPPAADLAAAWPKLIPQD